MAHESFEDAAVAGAVNANFVAIKVDREERPDVDAVYMAATQAMTGQGGWPMTVFATPDGQPFFCGTYFPRDAFLRLLAAVTTAWTDQRPAVLSQGATVVEAIDRSRRREPAAVEVTTATLDAAAEALSRDFDERYGGFGGAPKFPPHLALLFLLRHHQRTGSTRSLEMVRATAEQMARGGIYDQIAGGFARYATDGTWTVPHFEKMLYDNALLLRVYTDLWRQTGDPLAARVARETVEFLIEGLRTPEGGFASALDADTGGAEGATYVWTPAQLQDTLGAPDAAWVADLLGVTAAGTFEHGTSVLRLARDIDGAPEIAARWVPLREGLRRARNARPQPARDDKVVAEWNGLAITALAEYAAVEVALDAGTGERALTAAVAAGALLVRTHLVGGRLRRVSRDGAVGQPDGVLADYGCVATAFATLHQVTGDPGWLHAAGTLLDRALDLFPDRHGGFFDTAVDAETLVTRPADPTDNATPSGNSAIIEALVIYTALTGETRYRRVAETALGTVAPVIAAHPRFAGLAAAAGEAFAAGPVEIAIVGPDPASRAGLLATARRWAPPGAVIVPGPASRPAAPDRPAAPGRSARADRLDVDRPGGADLGTDRPAAADPFADADRLAGSGGDERSPLLAGRPLVDGRPTAYVCRGFVCDRPVTEPDALERQLRN